MVVSERATSFNCEVEKGNFPYRFIYSDNINSVRALPGLNYYDDISIIDYNTLTVSFKNKDW